MFLGIEIRNEVLLFSYQKEHGCLAVFLVSVMKSLSWSTVFSNQTTLVFYPYNLFQIELEIS